jgi:hypothetical protein
MERLPACNRFAITVRMGRSSHEISNIVALKSLLAQPGARVFVQRDQEERL